MKIVWLADSQSPHVQRWVSVMSRKGIHIHVISFNKVNNPLLYIFQLPRIFRSLDSLTPDIVHAHYASSYGVAALIYSLKAKVKVVTSIWGSDLLQAKNRGWLYNFLLKRVLLYSDILISNSDYLSRECKRYIGRSCDQIPFGIDLSNVNYKPFRIPDRVVNVCIFKRLHIVAGVDVAIRAIAILNRDYKDRELILNIYGDGPERNNLEYLVDSLGLNKNVVFHGWIQPDNISEAYCHSDIAIYPSRIEGLGVSIIEAMANCVLVLTINGQGISELICSDANGFSVQALDPDRFAEKLIEIIENPERASLKVSNAFSFVKEKYNIDDNAVSLLDVYRLLLDR